MEKCEGLFSRMNLQNQSGQIVKRISISNASSRIGIQIIVTRFKKKKLKMYVCMFPPVLNATNEIIYFPTYLTCLIKRILCLLRGGDTTPQLL